MGRCLWPQWYLETVRDFLALECCLEVVSLGSPLWNVSYARRADVHMSCFWMNKKRQQDCEGEEHIKKTREHWLVFHYMAVECRLRHNKSLKCGFLSKKEGLLWLKLRNSTMPFFYILLLSGLRHQERCSLSHSTLSKSREGFHSDKLAD